MPLKELGSLIQAARQSKGLSIDEVAAKLKVHRHTLRAIEEGDIDDMPEPVYARGFTRAYAAHVGIAPDIVLEAIDQAFPLEKTPEYTDKTDRSVPYIKPHRRASSKSPLLALLILIILIAAGIWYYMNYMRAPETPASPSTQEESTDSPPGAPAVLPGEAAASSPAESVEEPAAEETPAIVEAPEPEANADPELAALPEAPVVPAAPATPEPVAPEDPEPVQTAQATPPQTQPTPPPVPEQEIVQSTPQNGQHSLVLRATETAWFSIMLDGVQRSYTFQQGQAAEFSFNRQATLRMGNAGGVSLVYDGTALPLPGARGEVRTMVFPPRSR